MNMISNFCFILCSTSKSSQSNLLFSIIAVIDLILLLYVVHSGAENLKKHISFILLSHGTVISLKELFNLSIFTSLILSLITILIYYNITYNTIMVRLICLINCILLVVVIKTNIVSRDIFSPIFCLRALFFTSCLIGILAITSLNVTLKIHTALVGFIVCTYILTGVAGINLLEFNTTDPNGNVIENKNGLFTSMISICILLALFYIEFAF